MNAACTVEPFTNFFFGSVSFVLFAIVVVAAISCCCSYFFLPSSLRKQQQQKRREKNQRNHFHSLPEPTNFNLHDVWMFLYAYISFRLVYVLVCSWFLCCSVLSISHLARFHTRCRHLSLSHSQFSYTFLFLFARTRLKFSFQCCEWTVEHGIVVNEYMMLPHRNAWDVFERLMCQRRESKGENKDQNQHTIANTRKHTHSETDAKTSLLQEHTDFSHTESENEKEKTYKLLTKV